MDLPSAEARGRFAASPRAILATVRPDGTPHLVPIVFALVDEVVYSAIDHKPKRSQRLQRLANLRHEPRCALLVDRYDDDWSQLWWVRADGRAEVLEAPNLVAQGSAALIERYPAYQDQAPEGPYLRIEVMRWSGWAAGRVS
jgi:PPOX class probable F420-dependent enzyme